MPNHPDIDREARIKRLVAKTEQETGFTILLNQTQDISGDFVVDEEDNAYWDVSFIPPNNNGKYFYAVDTCPYLTAVWLIMGFQQGFKAALAHPKAS